MSDSPKIQDFASQPRILEILLEDNNPVVIVQPSRMFAGLFPDGRIDGDPGLWGIILADAVKHVVQAHHGALTRLSEHAGGPTPPPPEAILDRLMQVLVDEVKTPNRDLTTERVVVAKPGSKN
jgi:hypothetical protein